MCPSVREDNVTGERGNAAYFHFQSHLGLSPDVCFLLSLPARTTLWRVLCPPDSTGSSLSPRARRPCAVSSSQVRCPGRRPSAQSAVSRLRESRPLGAAGPRSSQVKVGARFPLRWGSRCGACLPTGLQSNTPRPVSPHPCVPLLLAWGAAWQEAAAGSRVPGRKSPQKGHTLPRSPLPRLPVSCSAKGERRRATWTSHWRCPRGPGFATCSHCSVVGARTAISSFPPAAGIFLNDSGRCEVSALTQQPPISALGGHGLEVPALGLGGRGAWALQHRATYLPCVPSRCPGYYRWIPAGGGYSQPSSIPRFSCNSAEVLK